MLPLANAIVADEALNQLFPNAPTDTPAITSFEEAMKWQSMVYSTVGRGGSLQLVSLIGFMISDAVFRSLIGHERLAWTELASQARNTLLTLRQLAQGKSGKLPMVIAVNGLKLASNVSSVEVAGGKLRRPTTPEQQLLLPNADNMTLVFETTYAAKVQVAKANPQEGIDKQWGRIQPQIEEAQRSFQRSIDMLRLALLLGSTTEEPLLLNEVSRFISDPLQAGGVQSWNPARFGIASHELKEEHVKEVKEWYEIIRSKHPQTLDIGMRRLLSATITRTDALDSFVDAVICWENMFGARTETTFRVTGSIVKLIGSDDTAARIELQSELKELYAKRSALVHGGKEPPVRKIWEYRTRAIEIAADCFRRLYSDRPDLLDLESDARGTRLLIE